MCSATTPAVTSPTPAKGWPMSVVPDVPQAGSAEPAPPPSVTSLRLPSTGWEVLPSRVATLCLLEVQKLRHDRTELVTRAIQPALWLLIFCQTFSRLRTIPTGRVSYLDFLAPGILAQSALFIAIFYGIQIIWERDAVEDGDEQRGLGEDAGGE